MSIVSIPAGNPGPYTGEGNNTYLLLGREPTLIDAGVGEPTHVAAIARALGGRDLARLIVTHAHSDHIDGTATLRRRWPNLAPCKVPWPEQDAAHGSGWRPLVDNERVPAGDGWLQVVRTPGHSPDHVCLLEEATRVLFGGDLLVSGGTVVIPVSQGGSLAAYLASLDRVAAIGPARVLPAHGPAIEEPVALIRRYQEHRRDRERQILMALSGGPASPSRLVDLIYVGLDPRLARAAAESVLAHLVKLEADGRARREGCDWVLARAADVEQ